MNDSTVRLSERELADLEQSITHALQTGDTSALDILGYGEISCVLGVRSGGQDLACKRLPLFHDSSKWHVYEECFAEYLLTLESNGVRPVASRLQSVNQPDAALAAWCIQPRLPSAGLLSKHFHSCTPAEAGRLFNAVLDRVVACVGPTVGLDAQLSNWILDGDELYYLDVTTPMLRTESGAERMPLAVFLASLPWALRPAVRRFMLRDILNKYYEPRDAVMDLLGNLYKEKLAHLLPEFAERASARVSPRITPDEAKRYYDADASSWALLQRLRHADRWWQTRVRHRTYPFLLPGKIER
jgi:hypothetical protein